jgi:hypothetical protein
MGDTIYKARQVFVAVRSADEAKTIRLVEVDGVVILLERPELQFGKAFLRLRQQGAAETAALMCGMNVEVLDPTVAKGNEAGHSVLVCYPDFTGRKYARAEESAVFCGRMEDGKKRHGRPERDAENAGDVVNVGWSSETDHALWRDRPSSAFAFGYGGTSPDLLPL